MLLKTASSMLDRQHGFNFDVVHKADMVDDEVLSGLARTTLLYSTGGRGMNHAGHHGVSRLARSKISCKKQRTSRQEHAVPLTLCSTGTGSAGGVWREAESLRN